VLAKDNNALAEVAHKMKGAAAMLGQDLLEAPLAQLEIDARQGIVKDLTNRIQNLQDVAKQSEAAFEHYVTLII
jgi:HPt (histidine-containing phosphotransfer) domain-containing protein